MIERRIKNGDQNLVLLPKEFIFCGIKHLGLVCVPFRSVLFSHCKGYHAIFKNRRIFDVKIRSERNV